MMIFFLSDQFVLEKTLDNDTKTINECEIKAGDLVYLVLSLKG